MAALIKSIVEKWVALYVRLSRDDENEGDSNSIAHQIEILSPPNRDTDPIRKRARHYQLQNL